MTIHLSIDATGPEDFLAQLRGLGFARETDDRLIARMRGGELVEAMTEAVAHARGEIELPTTVVPVAAIAGTDDSAQIPLPGTMDAPQQPKRTRRTKAQIEADNAAAAATTQPAVVDNTGSAQPFRSPAADGASQATTGGPLEGLPEEGIARTDAPVVAEITPDAFRAKLQEAVASLTDGMRHVGALLQEFGYEKVKDVQSADYAKIVARVDQLVADGKVAA